MNISHPFNSLACQRPSTTRFAVPVYNAGDFIISTNHPRAHRPFPGSHFKSESPSLSNLIARLTLSLFLTLNFSRSHFCSALFFSRHSLLGTRYFSSPPSPSPISQGKPGRFSPQLMTQNSSFSANKSPSLREDQNLTPANSQPHNRSPFYLALYPIRTPS